MSRWDCRCRPLSSVDGRSELRFCFQLDEPDIQVRDWANFIKELMRVLKPGGLLVSVDGSTNWPVFDKVDDFNTPLLPEQAMIRAPGFCRLLAKLFE